MTADTILVTGATGFAGSHLLDALRGNPARIVAWRHAKASLSTRTPGVLWQQVDLLDRDAVRTAVRAIRPDFIYHCAGAAHVGHSWGASAATLSVNVLGTHHLVDAVRLARLQPRLVIPSSAMIYRPSSGPIREDHPIGPASPYGLSKLAQEMLGRHGLAGGAPAGLIARAFNHVGPRQDPSFAAAGFARQIARIEAGLAPPVLMVGNLDAQRDLSDVRDTVRAYRMIMERGTPGVPYNVCSGRTRSIRVLLELLLAGTTARITLQVDPARYRPNDAPVLLGDNSRLRTELGWSPQIPLETTAADLLRYWRSRVQEDR